MASDEGEAASSAPDVAAAALRGRERRFQRGIRALLLGAGANIVLVALKGTVGVLRHSQALVADAVHSGGDLANSLMGPAASSIRRSRVRAAVSPR